MGMVRVDNQSFSGIYNIVNLFDGSRYIGQTADLKRREHDHSLMLKGNRHENKHLQNAVNKYGLKNFEFRVLEKTYQMIV